MAAVAFAGSGHYINGNIRGDWTQFAGTVTTTNLVTCPNGTALVNDCGLRYNNTSDYLTDSSGSFGWHNYANNTGLTVSTYLNGNLHLHSSSTTKLTFTLSDPNATTLHNNTNLNYSSGNIWWRQPSWYINQGSYGYFLSAGQANTPESITIDFPVNPSPAQNTVASYLSKFYFYWGSVDSWNTVTFTDTRTSSNTTAFTGSNFACAPGVTTGCISVPFNPATGNFTPDTSDAVFQFSAQQTCDTALTTCWIYPLQSVTFSSSQPAFEFDNVQFDYASCATAPAGNPGGTGACYTAYPGCTTCSAPISAPAPEVPSLALLGTGISTAAALFRRKLLGKIPNGF
jgi:hypothetical protein